MKSPMLLPKWLLQSLALSIALAMFGSSMQAADAAKDQARTEAQKNKPTGALSGELVPLILNLPAAAFKPTPPDIQLSSFVEPLSEKPRPPMMVPPGLENLASKAKLTSSDKNARQDSLAKIIDGDKETSDQSIIFLRKGTQY